MFPNLAKKLILGIGLLVLFLERLEAPLGPMLLRFMFELLAGLLELEVVGLLKPLLLLGLMLGLLPGLLKFSLSSVLGLMKSSFRRGVHVVFSSVSRTESSRRAERSDSEAMNSDRFVESGVSKSPDLSAESGLKAIDWFDLESGVRTL